MIYKITAFIPKGKVLTYNQLAKLAEIKNPRVVGNILHQNKDPKNIPCHRIVNSKGQVAKNFAFGGSKGQINKLLSDEVLVKNNQVDLVNHLWQPGKITILYLNLLKKYGEPGPWPWFLSSLSSSGQVPATPEEIAIGAILTQNTNWKNVEKAIDNLKQERVCAIREVNKLGESDYNKLKTLIRPAGFYNQKAHYLFGFCKYIIENFRTLENFFKLPLKEAREELLKLNGIGRETADTILLYAGRKPVFVIDVYTKRFAEKHNFSGDFSYDALQQLFTKSLPIKVRLYRDYHALIVRWGKENKARIENFL